MVNKRQMCGACYKRDTYPRGRRVRLYIRDDRGFHGVGGVCDVCVLKYVEFVRLCIHLQLLNMKGGQ